MVCAQVKTFRDLHHTNVTTLEFKTNRKLDKELFSYKAWFLTVERKAEPMKKGQL